MEKEEQIILAEKAIRGDKEALEQLILDKQKDITYIASRYIKDKSMVEDVTQQAIIEIYSHIDSLKNPHAFSFWLYRVVVFICKNMNRNEHIRAHAPFDEDIMNNVELQNEFLPQTFSESQEKTELLLQEFKKLPENYQELLFLKYFASLSYEQIGIVMDMTETRANSLMARARKKLKLRLEQRTGKKLRGSYMLSAAPVPVLTQALQLDAQKGGTLGLTLQQKPPTWSSGMVKALSLVAAICIAIGGLVYSMQGRKVPVPSEQLVISNDKLETEEPVASEPELASHQSTIPDEEVLAPLQEEEWKDYSDVPQQETVSMEYDINNSVLYEVTGDPNNFDAGDNTDPLGKSNNATVHVRNTVNREALQNEGVKTGDQQYYYGYIIIMILSVLLMLRRAAILKRRS